MKQQRRRNQVVLSCMSCALPLSCLIAAISIIESTRTESGPNMIAIFPKQSLVANVKLELAFSQIIFWHV